MQQMKNKKERGITLIALVVTIIVLIILAGISINLVFGNFGVITKLSLRFLTIITTPIYCAELLMA